MARKTRMELEGHWTRILDDFAESNCGVSQYCQEHKVSKASLYKWSQRLGIPIKNRCTLSEIPSIENKNVQSIAIGNEAPFSFIELNAPPPNVNTSLPVKFELLLSQGRFLKIETASSWEGVVGMIKALVS